MHPLWSVTCWRTEKNKILKMHWKHKNMKTDLSHCVWSPSWVTHLSLLSHQGSDLCRLESRWLKAASLLPPILWCERYVVTWGKVKRIQSYYDSRSHTESVRSWLIYGHVCKNETFFFAEKYAWGKFFNDSVPSQFTVPGPWCHDYNIYC